MRIAAHRAQSAAHRYATTCRTTGCRRARRSSHGSVDRTGYRIANSSSSHVETFAFGGITLPCNRTGGEHYRILRNRPPSGDV